MTQLLLTLALGAGALSSFPRPAGGPVVQPAIGITLDGQPAVLLVAGEEVVAFRAGGATPRGFPLPLGAGEVASGAPAAGDLDRDGVLEIAVATTGGKLHLWAGGRAVPGFPVSLGAPCRAAPAFVDVDGDGRPEVVVGDARGRLHAFRKNGRESPGWPVSLGAAVTSSAASSRFAGGPSLAVGLSSGQVQVLALPGGKSRPGFPLATGFEVTGAPAFADLDQDGQMELVVASQDFKLYAVNEAGKPLPGFPAEAGYRLYEGPAIADLDGDGRLDVAFTSADGYLHAVSADGRKLAGFPVRVGGRLFAGAVIGDLDRDGRPDVVAVASDGQVLAVGGDGKPLPGFPTRLEGGEVAATPLLFDLEGDGSLSAFLGLPSGEVHALRAQRLGTAAAVAPWPAAGHDAARTGRFGPNPPRFSALVLAPLLPRASDKLTASWHWASADALPGDPAPVPALEWYRNGVAVPDLRGKREVPPGITAKGELWRFAILPPGGAPPVRSPEVMVSGTPPAGQVVAVEPTRPTRSQSARAVITHQARDPDGDAVAYRYEWLLDGLPTGVKDDVFPARLMRRGATLTVRAWASDGETESEPTAAEVRVANAPPSAPVVALSAAAVRRGDVLSVRLVTPASDPDDDPIAYRHRWTVDGEPRNYALDTLSLPPGTLRKRQKVRVEVRAFDGEEEGPAASAEVTVANTAPTAPRLEVQPARPRRGDALRAVVVSPSVDADGDPLGYRFSWAKNGKPLAVAGDGREVPGSEVRRGDRFEVEAWANDGELDGPHARAAVEAGNTPPTAPVIALQPSRPRGGDPLQVVIQQPSRDADGDQVSYDIAWTREGKALPEKSETLAGAQVPKNARIRVTVTPRDDAGAGAPARAEVIAINSPPTRPEVELDPRDPTSASGLRVRIRTPATDADKDTLTYRYAWSRDGVLVNVNGSEVAKGQLRRGEVWTVAVRAFDGEEPGEPATAGATVKNTPPPVPQVAIRPEAPVTGQALRCETTAPERDADGDRVEIRIRWTRGGESTPVVEGPPDLPAGLIRRGERWGCEASAWDGADESARARAEVPVLNSPPGAPKVVIELDRRGEGLACRLAAEAIDPDGDRLRYAYSWTRDDSAIPPGSDPTRVEPRQLRRGQRWGCQVTASDGMSTGPPGSAERIVPNGAPGPARVRLAPATPRSGEALKCELHEKSVDPDGDTVRYTYAWTRNGQPQPFAPGADEVPGRLVKPGDKWRCVATPSDGELSGPPAATAEATVPPPREAR